MTIKYFKKIKCPGCGIKNEVMIWDSINAQISPQDRDALIHGNIHVFTCASCGKTHHILKSLLYHDMKNRFFAYFYPFQETEESKFYKQFHADGRMDFSKAGYKDEELEDYQRNVHVVFSMEELVRYIKFREKLAEHYQSKSV